jgi:hypothetical protein
MAGGTQTCDTRTLKLVSPTLGLQDGHGVGRGGRLEADGEEDNFLIRVGLGDLDRVERE